MAADDEGLVANLPIVPIPDELWAQSIFIAGYRVSSEEGIRELQQRIEMLRAPRRHAHRKGEDLLHAGGSPAPAITDTDAIPCS